MFSARYQILRLFYALCDKINQWRDQNNAEKQAEQEHLNAYLEQQKTEKLLFLALLQTMVKVCEELKPKAWVSTYNGLNPGPVVRALTDKNDPTVPLYEIHIEDPHRNGNLSNYCNIGVFQQTPQFERIYSGIHYFVPDKYLQYLKAVFYLTADRKASPSFIPSDLLELKNLKIKKTEHWNEYPMAHAIQYLESLLTKNSK